MALMRALNQPPEVPLPAVGWKLVATEAGRYATGLRATIQLWNQEQQGIAQLTLAVPGTWADFMAEVVEKAACGAEAVTSALRTLTTAIEGVLREVEEQAERISHATALVELAGEVELFHTPGADSEAYAIIPVEDHQEVWRLKANGFRRWLERQFYQIYEKAPGGQAVQDALGVLGGKALFDGPEQAVFTRLAAHDGAIYLDLANEQWEAVEITATGWHVMANPPVKFRRARGMLALRAPVKGGRIDALRPFINVGSEADWTLLVAWLLAALRPVGPYPVLVLHGEQGAAKSTTARVLRAMIDPNSAPLRAEPRDARDVMIAASNGWCVSLDNVSHLPPWLSDAICRLATGGGFATRQLYSDNEEMLFDAQRPVILNGIEELATRGDLLDRAIILYLPSIPEEQRRPEAEFWGAFEQARPMIFGALLDAVSMALAKVHTTKLAKLPRMADFALWVMAAESALGWEAGAFLDAYMGNRQQVNELALEAALIVPPLRDLLAEKGGTFTGTATDLLHALHEQAEERTRKAQGWPSNGRVMSNALRRVAPNLRQVGVDVMFHPRESRRRLITVNINSKEQGGNFASLSSPSSSLSRTPLNNNSLGSDATGDANAAGDANAPFGDAPVTQPYAPTNPHPSSPVTQGDDSDARKPINYYPNETQEEVQEWRA